MASLSIKGYLKEVLFNVIVVFILALVIPLIVHLIMGGGWLRFLIVSIVSIICSIISILFVGCSKVERNFLIVKLRSILTRLHSC